MSDWIDAEERLPPSNERVLVFHCDGHCHHGRIVIGRWSTHSNGFVFDTKPGWLAVKWWMPLPEEP